MKTWTYIIFKIVQFHKNIMKKNFMQKKLKRLGNFICGRVWRVICRWKQLENAYGLISMCPVLFRHEILPEKLVSDPIRPWVIIILFPRHPSLREERKNYLENERDHVTTALILLLWRILIDNLIELQIYLRHKDIGVRLDVSIKFVSLHIL